MMIISKAIVLIGILLLVLVSNVTAKTVQLQGSTDIPNDDSAYCRTDNTIYFYNYDYFLMIDISGITDLETFVSSDFCMYAEIKAFTWDGDVTAWKIDNYTWDEDINASQFEALSVIYETNYTSKWTTADTWDCIDVTDMVNLTINNSQSNVSLKIRDQDIQADCVQNATVDSAIYDSIGKGFSLNTYIYVYDQDYEGAGTLRPYLNITYIPVTPEINENYTTPASPSLDDTVIITVNASDGNYVASVNFTIEYPNGTLMFENENGTQYDAFLWNSSSFITDIEGSYNITVFATDDEGNEQVAQWNFTLPYTTAVPNITNTSWSIAFASGSSSDLYFHINNTGDRNATHCNVSLTSTIGSATYDTSDFTIQSLIPVTVKATFTGSTTGSDSSAQITVNCTVNQSGNTASSSLNGSISISTSTPPSSGGGGGGYVPPDTCGSYVAYPKGGFSGTASPGEKISQFFLQIYNGNISQSFYANLDGNISDYCEVVSEPSDEIPVNGYGEIIIECIAPEGISEGHIEFVSDTGCEDSRPLTIIGSNGFISDAVNFVYSIIRGDLSGIQHNTVMITIFLIVIIAVILIILKNI